ncbi:MAG: sugar phosphate isomerase/epimerase family protein, partial [Spirochaetota bacterium]
MKLAISSYTFSWGFGTAGYPQPAQPLTPERLIGIAVSFGVSTVQIADNAPLDELDPVRVDELFARAREEGIALELGTSGTEPDNLLRYLELATRCGASVLRSVPKGTVPIGDVEADRAFTDATVASVSSVVDDFEAAGVTLCLENYEGYSVHSLRRAVDRIASDRVRVCLDSLNSLGRSEGYETVVGALACVTGNLHVKDYRARRLDHRLGY